MVAFGMDAQNVFLIYEMRKNGGLKRHLKNVFKQQKKELKN